MSATTPSLSPVMNNKPHLLSADFSGGLGLTDPHILELLTLMGAEPQALPILANTITQS
ncbi:MAG: hypothetical protein II954_08315 [Synergistaceae bacterium]|nr:hypothetical protein [Synergistaceae bacterium]